MTNFKTLCNWYTRQKRRHFYNNVWWDFRVCFFSFVFFFFFFVWATHTNEHGLEYYYVMNRVCVRAVGNRLCSVCCVLYITEQPGWHLKHIYILERNSFSHALFSCYQLLLLALHGLFIISVSCLLYFNEISSCSITILYDELLLIKWMLYGTRGTGLGHYCIYSSPYILVLCIRPSRQIVN